MSDKKGLRLQREGTVINTISKKQEKLLQQAVFSVMQTLQKESPTLHLQLEAKVFLKEVTDWLKHHFTESDFTYHFETSSMKPDGVILFLVDKHKQRYPLLISEKKNQGTNDLRKQEGKTKQAKGNAIERLGKNVIGLKAFLATESIFPFVCFGDGCDFASDSSILDRVSTIAEFGKLNTVYLFEESDGRFRRGSFFFREALWTVDEMVDICYHIAERSLHYYFAKYSKAQFI
ncbi:MAG: EcoRI family type II restriction endonuclease [Vampirovibrionales bacterium]